MQFSEYSKTPRILCYGDSNTFGYDPVHNSRYPETARYPAVLQAILGDEFHIVDEGLPGRTSAFDAPAAEGMNGLTTITPILLSHAPLDTVTIMLGTNDSSFAFHAEPRTIAACIVRLVRKALTTTECWRSADDPDVLVICPTPITAEYYATRSRDPYDSGCDLRSSGIAAELEPLLEQIPHVRFLDAGKLPDVQNSKIDGLHLTPESHCALAKALAENLREHYADRL